MSVTAEGLVRVLVSGTAVILVLIAAARAYRQNQDLQREGIHRARDLNYTNKAIMAGAALILSFVLVTPLNPVIGTGASVVALVCCLVFLWLSDRQGPDGL